MNDFFTGKGEILLQIDEDISPYIDGIKDAELTIKISKYHKKRSLNANNYYWQICGEMAGKLHVSNAYIHNMMLRKYGQVQDTFADEPVMFCLKDCEEVWKKVDELTEIHLLPTSQVEERPDGAFNRWYIKLKGSHEYNSKEMARLIDGTVEEAKELGIQTMTPQELERLVSAWHPKS